MEHCTRLEEDQTPKAGDRRDHGNNLGKTHNAEDAACDVLPVTFSLAFSRFRYSENMPKKCFVMGSPSFFLYKPHGPVEQSMTEQIEILFNIPQFARDHTYSKQTAQIALQALAR